MTSQQSIEDRTLAYQARIDERIERLHAADHVTSNILESHNEPVHTTLENANLKNGSVVESDPVFLRLKKYWMDASFSSTDLSFEAANRINRECTKLRSRTMDESTYTAYLKSPESELGNLLFGGSK